MKQIWTQMDGYFLEMNSKKGVLDVNKTACVCNGKRKRKKQTSSSFFKSLSLPWSMSFLKGLDVESTTICQKTANL